VVRVLHRDDVARLVGMADAIAAVREVFAVKTATGFTATPGGGFRSAAGRPWSTTR
jgi:hypothetical protein